MLVNIPLTENHSAEYSMMRPNKDEGGKDKKKVLT